MSPESLLYLSRLNGCALVGGLGDFPLTLWTYPTLLGLVKIPTFTVCHHLMCIDISPRLECLRLCLRLIPNMYDMYELNIVNTDRHKNRSFHFDGYSTHGRTFTLHFVLWRHKLTYGSLSLALQYTFN